MIYMMAPSYDQTADKKKKTKNKRKQVKQQRLPWKLMLSFLLVIMLMLTAWIQERSISGKEADHAALQDFNQLVSWSGELLDGGAMSGQWSLRWDVTLAYDTLEGLAKELFINERGELLPKNIRANGDVYDGEWLVESSVLRLARTEQDKLAEKVTITLQIDASELEKASELKETVGLLHRKLQAKDQNVQMNIKVFGQAKHDQVLDDLKRLAVAQTVDEYLDRGTKSVTYFTNQIKQYRWVDNGSMVNLQASLHRNSEDGQLSLTLGVPLISGEFGEIVDPSDFN